MVMVILYNGNETKADVLVADLDFGLRWLGRSPGWLRCDEMELNRCAVLLRTLQCNEIDK